MRELFLKLSRVQKFRVLGCIVISVVVLCAMGLYNGAPLIFNSDTAMYMDAADKGVVGNDRPILYGLFMKYASLDISLWFVVFFQAMIVSSVLFFYFKNFFPPLDKESPERKYHIGFILYIIVVSLGMGASFEVSWLMSDIFTPIAILIMGVFLFVKKVGIWTRIAFSVLFVLSICMHNANFYICLGLLLVSITAMLFKAVRITYNKIGITSRRLGFVFLLLLGSSFSSSCINFFYGGGFAPGRGGTMFLMGNLVEMGIIDTYLEDQCAVKNYEICKYKDSIPNNFLWDQRSPVYKMGGWKGSEKEYAIIVEDVLTTPKYLKTFIFGSCILTLKQMATFETGEAFKPTRHVNLAIRNYYYRDFKTFMAARQSNKRLDFSGVNFLQALIFGFCTIVYALVFIFKGLTERLRIFSMFLIFSVLINAWICGTFSGAYPRYQSRVVWLMPLPLFLYLLEHYQSLLPISYIKNRYKIYFNLSNSKFWK